MNKWSQKCKIMRRYDLTARMYDERYAEEQLAKYRAALKHLDIQGSILDVGCGTGLFFSHVVADVQTVVGMDISRLLLLQAKERARAYLNVYLVQADADYLPFREACFDVVFIFTVLQNMQKPLETLRALKRNAKRGAHVVVSGLKKIFSLEAFTVLLHDSGLQVISLEDGEALKCHVAVTVRR